MGGQRELDLTLEVILTPVALPSFTRNCLDSFRSYLTYTNGIKMKMKSDVQEEVTDLLRSTYSLLTYIFMYEYS